MLQFPPSALVLIAAAYKTTRTAFIPDTAVIIHEDWRLNAGESERRTKSDLKEKHYFEPSYRNEQATWSLDRKYYQKKLPALETFCEVMFIPDLDRRKQGLSGWQAAAKGGFLGMRALL